MKAFDCRMCGECCYGEGGIVVSREEAKRIAGHLGIGAGMFIMRYCEIRHGRMYLRTGPDRYCVFLERGKGCRIHPVKPAVCSLWPFFPANLTDRENWEAAKEACPGISRDCSFEDFVAQSKK
ncbi:MAG: YkgJ family cysteine cluster protein [Deltaproteobacteria bacterium]|nr:MAG: YkgJ family cysteine cluster protein [Deltaproteobacteria bacterium]